MKESVAGGRIHIGASFEELTTIKKELLFIETSLRNIYV
jgi:hypothetical protein